MIFASFIRRGQDIRDIRDVLGEDGAHIKIIAKIENRQGLNNFADILRETDGVMVARGDMGIEIPAAEVFSAQKKVCRSLDSGRPGIREGDADFDFLAHRHVQHWRQARHLRYPYVQTLPRTNTPLGGHQGWLNTCADYPSRDA